MVARRASDLCFGVLGGLDFLLRLFGSHMAPQCPPGRFWRISGVIWGVILNPKSVKFGVDFRCVFGMLFGGVLDWFWDCFGRLFGAKTMIKKKRDDLWK